MSSGLTPEPKQKPVGTPTTKEEALTLSNRLQHDLMQGLLMQQGVMIEDAHVDFGNGYHGTSYLNAHPFMHDPSKVMELAEELLQSIPRSIRDQADMIIGPITGGALLAFSMAVRLEATRDFGPTYKVPFAPIYKHDGQLAIRRHYREIIAGKLLEAGKRVIIVDDVCNTGTTLRKSRQLVEESGGRVLATAVLYDRMSTVKMKDHYSLGHCDVDPGLVRQEDCVQCKFKVEITQF